MLIEAIVAIAVVAMMLAVTFRATAEDALRVHAADASRAALLIARSRLTEASVALPFEPGTAVGNDGPYDWSVMVQPEPASSSAAGTLWRLTASVVERGHAGVRARLTTLALAPPSS